MLIQLSGLFTRKIGCDQDPATQAEVNFITFQFYE